MDNAIQELITLLGDMLANQQALLEIAIARRDALKAFATDRLQGLMEEEQIAARQGKILEEKRIWVIAHLKKSLGLIGGVSVSVIAKKCPEPAKTELLRLAEEIKVVVGTLQTHSRVNAKVSEAVAKGLNKVMKVMTGVAQHAGIYLRNGRKAAMQGSHLLEITA